MAPTFDISTALTDLTGKVAIVTGGNKGIGFETVKGLVRAGAKVYLAARNGADAVERIREEKKKNSWTGEVESLKIELLDPEKAKAAALEFMQKEDRLDILINNAGLNSSIGVPYETGRDGFSNMVLVNFLGPMVFTQNLLPLMISTSEQPNSDVRIVNVTSMMHKLAPSSFKASSIGDLKVSYQREFFSDMKRYTHSKLLVILWSKALQRHLTKPITVIAVHPGAVNTFNDSWSVMLRPIQWFFLAKIEVGGYPSLVAAAGKVVADNKDAYKGAYLTEAPVPGSISTPSKMAKDENLSEELWVTTMAYVKEAGLV